METDVMDDLHKKSGWCFAETLFPALATRCAHQVLGNPEQEIFRHVIRGVRVGCRDRRARPERQMERSAFKDTEEKQPQRKTLKGKLEFKCSTRHQRREDHDRHRLRSSGVGNAQEHAAECGAE